MWQIFGPHVSKSNAETGTSAPNTLVKISTPKANQTFTQPNPYKIKKDILVSPSCSKLIILPDPQTDTDIKCIKRKSVSVKVFSPGKANTIYFNLMFIGFLIKKANSRLNQMEEFNHSSLLPLLKSTVI